MACPLPTKSSDAKSSEFQIMNHHPYLPEPVNLHDFGQELGEKGKYSRWRWFIHWVYSHNLRKERKGNKFLAHLMTTHIYVYLEEGDGRQCTLNIVAYNRHWGHGASHTKAKPIMSRATDDGKDIRAYLYGSSADIWTNPMPFPEEKPKWDRFTLPAPAARRVLAFKISWPKFI